MNKRITYVLGTMSLGLALVLAGCGANTDTNKQDAASSATQPAASAPAASGEKTTPAATEPLEKSS